ncbi:MAG: AarF/UbiB family protein [Coriobacteriia bacterium]|nr:AarF/UbiB family protein [Coriobacteriia bacterium]
MSARSRRITGVVVRHMAAGVVRSLGGLSPKRRAVFAREWRLAFEELGPAFIKLGQLISVRPDEFPAELVAEMAAMQDNVPAVSAAAIRRVIAEEFGRTPEQLFATFDDTPIASASIAQVHGATLAEAVRPVWGDVLPAGADVVVKVVRPGSASAILADVAEARRLIERVQHWGLFRDIDLHALLDEFEQSVARELDLRVEGRIADRFAFDFREDPKIEIPRIVWGRTTARVVTMERITGWRLTEIDEAALAGIDAKALAIYGATAFMRQVMVYGRYHADLHPANLFVTPRDTIAYLDFGIVGHLTKDEREDIAQVLAGLAYRDPDRALRYSRRLGVDVPPEKVAAVKRELGVLLDSMFEPGGSHEFRHFGLGFIALLRRNGIGIPAGYGLLVKSLATVEGCARSLYPDIDIIDTARPFVTRLLADSFGKPQHLQGRVESALRAALREMVA